MRGLFIALGVALTLVSAGCGNSSDAAKASGKARLFDAQQDALEKAKAVNSTVLQADKARRAQEQNQSQ